MKHIISSSFGRTLWRISFIVLSSCHAITPKVSAAPVQLFIAYDGTNAIITWPSGGCILQCSTDDVMGPYVDVIRATSPYVASVREKSAFYRLSCPDVHPQSIFELPRTPMADPEPFESPGSRAVQDRGEFGTPYVDCALGECVIEACDLKINGLAGIGLDFNFCRLYRSGWWRPSGPLGNRWTHSYDIYIQQMGDCIKVFNGDLRWDLYCLRSDGTYGSDQFFCEGTFSNGFFRLTFPHGGFWEFNALDGSLEQGYIKRIEERRGNSLRFEYAAGKLQTIYDTLNREIRIEYNQQGLASKVIDFTGRYVQYQYYGPGDTNGSPGDLKCVISPAVTGMPFNNFPGGKTNKYVYTTRFSNTFMNSLLLCAIDGKGQKWLRNEYYTDSANSSFGRVLSQTWGNQDDRFDFVYVTQPPTANNRFCTQKTIVNDRRGVVKEFCFDAGNHLLEQCVYTGFADPLQPTTETLNRPTGKPRPDDPDCWRTRYEWLTNDSLLKTIIFPNGNSVSNVYQAELAQTSRRFRANLRERWEFPGPLGGDPPVRKELFEYAIDFGGCCGFNFVTKHTDKRTNVTIMAYDERGNRTNITGRVPTIGRSFQHNPNGQLTSVIGPDNGSGYRSETRSTYYPAETPQAGYLMSEIVDAGTTNLNLTTTYEYNAVGLVTNMTDPRGHVTSWIVNQLNQQLVRLSPAIESNPAVGPVRYFQNTFYDANNFIEKTETSNFDDQGVLQPNPVFTTEFRRDVLNVITQKVEEVTATNFIVTQFSLNTDHEVIETRFGEATSGRQPCNTVALIIDERQRVFRKIRAPDCPEQSTDQFNYDGNLNLTCTIQGLEGIQPRTNCVIYNGYNLPVVAIDAMGNRRTSEYDGNDNVIHQLIQGELCDVPGGAANVRLYEKRTHYDAEDRRIREDVHHFDTDTQTPVGDGLAMTRWEWTANSQVARVVNDNLHQKLLRYDGAYRLSVTTDHKGNTRRMSYNEDSLVTSVTEVEKSDLGNPDQMFTQTMAYDELDRLLRKTDNVGNSQHYRFDSRNNRTLVIDALGNQVRHNFDGLNRLVMTILDLDADGADGDGADIVTTQTWDDSSRLVSKVDPNGNATSYIFDPLNRIIQETFADCTAQRYRYDVHDNLVSSTDPNGSVATNRHDLANRLIRRDVTRGAGVSGTTFETYCYDGLSRLTRATDDDSVVSRSHDSLSHVIRESQELVGAGPAQMVRCVYDGVGNMTQCFYPSGRLIDLSYDELERKIFMNDSDFGFFASYSYVGPERVERRYYGNFTQTDYMYDGITGIPNATNDFGVKKLVGIKHSVSASGVDIDHRSYTWDQVYNKMSQKDLTEGPQFVHEYTYEATVYRLRQTIVRDRDFPAGGSIRRNELYRFDKTGNRTNVVGGLNPGNYFMDDVLCEPADEQMNQYTSVPAALSSTNELRSYDGNGNLFQLLVRFNEGEQQRLCTYDYRNQMVQFEDRRTAPLPAGQRTTYTYDALGRRIAKVVDLDGTPETTRYIYDGWQIVEEQDGLGNTLATYVYGLYIDDVLNMNRSGTNYYYHADDIYNVRAITDIFASVVETYEYGDYGQVLDVNTLNGQIVPLGTGNPSDVGNPYFFTGRRLDPESQWYDYRTRYLNPIDGRFTTRDGVGLWGDVAHLGNGYTYWGNRPSDQNRVAYASDSDQSTPCPEHDDACWEQWCKDHPEADCISVQGLPLPEIWRWDQPPWWFPPLPGDPGGGTRPRPPRRPPSAACLECYEDAERASDDAYNECKGFGATVRRALESAGGGGVFGGIVGCGAGAVIAGVGCSAAGAAGAAIGGALGLLHGLITDDCYEEAQDVYNKEVRDCRRHECAQ